jgi:formate-nitrite transporter family protein
MAGGGWLVFATPPNISQIVSIYIVTFLIGIGRLHHSIAGSAEMFTALFISDQFTLQQVVRCVGISIMGKLVGGSVFVGALNYAHIRKIQKLAAGSPVPS